MALLDAAGYTPDPETGWRLQTSIIINGTSQDAIDISSIVKEYFADIGVDMELEILEYGAYSAINSNHQYDQLFCYYTNMCIQGDPMAVLTSLLAPGLRANHNWYDADWLAQLEVAKGTQDDAARLDLYKELAVDAMIACPQALTPTTLYWNFWHPWLKGYSGQWAYMIMEGTQYKHWWIDLDMREAMTGTR